MNLAALSAAYPGYQAARGNDALIKQREMANQEAVDDRASLEALGRAFGMPQPAPPPQGAGQPSVPRQAPPMPAIPQGNPAVSAAQAQGPMPIPAPPAAPPGGMPVGNAPPPQAMPAPPARPIPPPGPSPGPSPSPSGDGQSGPPALAGPAQQPGQMTVESLIQRIVRANPGIEKNPGVLTRALAKGQQLLLPEERLKMQELASQSKFDIELRKISEATNTAILKATTASQVAEIRAAAAEKVAAIADESRRAVADTSAGSRRDVANTNVAGRKDVAAAAEEGKDRRLGLTLDNKTAIAAAHDAVRKELGSAKSLTDPSLIGSTLWYRQRMIELKERGLADAAAKAQMDHDVKLVQEEGRNARATQSEAGKTATLAERGREADQTEAGRNARAKTMNIGRLTQMATKYGVAITDDMDPAAIQKATADAVAKKADSLKPDPQTVQFLAEAARTDPSLFSRLGRNDALKKSVYDAFAKLPGIEPGDVASAKVALGEKQEAGRVIGRVEGATRQAAEEVAPFAKLVRASAAKVDNTKYPTLNAVMQAAKRGTGDPDVVALANNIAALKRGFTQAMARGGTSSVDAQRRADELISMTMAPRQLDAAIASMEKEISGIAGATERATKGIASEAGGKPAAAAGPAADSEDPYGLLK